MAADVVAMAPGTNMGAAHPVAVGGTMDEVMSKKVTSDAAAYVRGKAERRGRNADLAEKAVVESRSFTESEAMQAGLAEFVVKDVGELVAVLDGREVKRFDGSRVRLALGHRQTETLEMDWRKAILSAIATPEILFLLLLGALAGLGAEISHPGLIFPGVLGGVCLILFLFASQVIPVNWAGVLLILLAVGLFVAEVKVTSYGLLTVGGIASMILGAMMLVDSPLPEFRPAVEFLVGPVLAFAAGAALLLRLVWRAQRQKPAAGREAMVGLTGIVESALEPEGWIIVQGERWRAKSASPASPGERVRIVVSEGLLLQVEKEA
jgi:membrane-bound serine protease (ClpP class)